jgi:hypothetical protein
MKLNDNLTGVSIPSGIMLASKNPDIPKSVAADVAQIGAQHKANLPGVEVMMELEGPNQEEQQEPISSVDLKRVLAVCLYHIRVLKDGKQESSGRDHQPVERFFGRSICRARLNVCESR